MRALQIDPVDNVAVAVQAVPPGSPVDIRSDLTIAAREAIPVGHKLALRDIAAGDMVIKYGVPIGRASRDIARGSHVHTQNVEDITTQLCLEYAATFQREVKA
jgi:altronate dehydratase|nr:UxaA family hydrolase [uncultured Oscillibacter sp.]